MAEENDYICRRAGLNGRQISFIAVMDAKLELGYKRVLVPKDLKDYGRSEKVIISLFYEHASGCERCRDRYEDSLAIARAIQEAPD